MKSQIKKQQIENLTLLGCILLLGTSILLKWINFYLGIYLCGIGVGFIVCLIYNKFVEMK
jgi:hypothetical protein